MEEKLKKFEEDIDSLVPSLSQTTTTASSKQDHQAKIRYLQQRQMQEALEMNELLRRAGAAGMLGNLGDEEGEDDEDDGDLYDP
jgi:hypothetical protein